jgi:hypothetical protein
MVDQRSDPHVFAPLCAKTSAPVRRISSIYVFSAHLLLRCASWLQSVLSSNAAWSSHDHSGPLSLLYSMSSIQSP